MIFGCFSDDLGCFSKKLRICKNMEKALVFTVFCKGRHLEKRQNQQKKHENSMKISNGKKEVTKLLENSIWEGLGLNLGGFGDALGRLWATFGRMLLAFWALKRISF